LEGGVRCFGVGDRVGGTVEHVAISAARSLFAASVNAFGSSGSMWCSPVASHLRVRGTRWSIGADHAVTPRLVVVGLIVVVSGRVEGRIGQPCCRIA
jgi:hypothetical protein